MSFSSNLKILMDSRHMRAVDLAKASGLSEPIISEYLKGKKEPRGQQSILLSKALNVSLDVLWETDFAHRNTNLTLNENALDVYPVDSFTRVPIIAKVKAGFGGFAEEDFDGYELCADLHGNPNDYVYFRVYNDSMAPEICEGDMALVRKQPEVESGELAVVIVNGEEGMLKRVKYKKGVIMLESFNPEYETRLLVGDEMNDFVVYGKVVKIERKY